MTDMLTQQTYICVLFFSCDYILIEWVSKSTFFSKFDSVHALLKTTNHINKNKYLNPENVS